MKTISVQEFYEQLAQSEQSADVDFINVCTPAEYKEQHIPGVRNVPLDELEAHKDEFADKRSIYVHCRSGRRGEQAVQRLKELGTTAELVNISGGLTAWNEAGLPTNSLTSRLPIMRQVFLIAGVLVVAGTILGYIVAPAWYVLSAGVGFGLTVAGVTGWCGMSQLLAKMPWNR